MCYLMLFFGCNSFARKQNSQDRGYLNVFHGQSFASRIFKRFSLPWRNASAFILTARWQWKWIRAPSVALTLLGCSRSGMLTKTPGHGEFKSCALERWVLLERCHEKTRKKALRNRSFVQHCCRLHWVVTRFQGCTFAVRKMGSPTTKKLCGNC